MHYVTEETIVDLVDNLQMAGQKTFHKFHVPCLKCFGKKRMVGEGKGPYRNIPGSVPVDPVEIDKKSHEFRNGEYRMRIIELYGNFIREIIERIVLSEKASEYVLE